MDFNKTELSADGINFVSRSSRNLGIEGKVKIFKNYKPFNSGLITVTLGGTYLLSAFIQPEQFYTGQNIKVLEPINDLSFNEKLFYCLCITKNRFKYSTHGREANVTLDNLLVPEISEIPRWVYTTQLEDAFDPKPLTNVKSDIELSKWRQHKLDDLFEIGKGQETINKCKIGGEFPLISAIAHNNGIYGYFEGQKALNPKNTMTIVMNGNSTGATFFQRTPYYATSDMMVLIPKFQINEPIALFISTIIKREAYRFSYGRKWTKERMKKSEILLPTLPNGSVDFNFINRFMNGMPYSSFFADQNT
jgi:restriction endonuclease S subunit